MTEHLPECAVAEARATATLWGVPADAHLSNPPPCICERLRACEERMRLQAVGSNAQRILIEHGEDCWRSGYSKALDAALEAVAPMEAVVLRIAATLVRHPSEDDLHDALQRHWCGELKAALFQYRAAIDALKESND